MTLEILLKIEEIRLKFGKKLEDFLRKNFLLIWRFIVEQYRQPQIAFLAVLVALYSRFFVDIGVESAQNFIFLRNFVDFGVFWAVFLSFFVDFLLLAAVWFFVRDKRLFWAFFAVYFLRIYLLVEGEYFSYYNWLIIVVFSRYLLAFLVILAAIFGDFGGQGLNLVLKYDIFPILLMMVLLQGRILVDESLKKLAMAVILTQLAVILFGNYSMAMRSVIWAPFLLLLLMIEPRFSDNIAKILVALLILILPQFDAQNFFDLLLNFCYFWWIFLIFGKKVDFLAIFLAFLSFLLIYFVGFLLVSWLFCAALLVFYCRDNFAVRILGFSYILSLFLVVFAGDFDEKRGLVEKFANEVEVVFAKSPLAFYVDKKDGKKLVFVKKNLDLQNSCALGLEKLLEKDDNFSKKYKFLTEAYKISKKTAFNDFFVENNVKKYEILRKNDEFEVFIAR